MTNLRKPTRSLLVGMNVEIPPGRIGLLFGFLAR